MAPAPAGLPPDPVVGMIAPNGPRIAGRLPSRKRSASCDDGADTVALRLQHFHDEPGSATVDLRMLDDEDDEVGPQPWALGDDDPDWLEPVHVDDGEEVGAADRWLDQQLARAGSGTDDGDPDRGQPSGRGGVALRRPAPTRRPRRRTADPDAVADLPAVAVPGYVRDRRGTWRYSATGQAVPGARDLTLRSLHRFPLRGGRVLIPVDQVRSEASLAWCLRWKDTLTTSLSSGRIGRVLRVPAAEWERRADIPFGLCAPELTPARLLGVADVARIARVTPATVTAYLARRRMPPPVARIGNSPVWSRPIIGQWLADRPGQGRVRPQHRRLPGGSAG